MKKLISLAVCLLMLLSLTACADYGSYTPVTPKPQPTIPPVTLPPVGYEVGNLCPGTTLPVVTGDGETGRTIDPTTTGKVTLINFWGTWCGPCVSELPHLDELAANYADSLTVIAIHSTQDARTMPSFLQKNYPDSPIIFSWETDNDYNGAYYLALGGEGYYPYTVVLDENGMITETRVGGMSYEEMQQLVENAGAVQSEAPQTAIPETEPQVVTPAIPQAQIEDAHSYTTTSAYGFFQCYHIPKLILPDGKADRVNKMMYDQLYPMVQEAENPVDEYTDYIMGMQYSICQSGDIISIVVSVRQPYNDHIDYSVYNVSAVTGSLLSDYEVFSYYGLTSAQGRDALVSYLDAYWEDHESDYGMGTAQMIPFIEDTYSEDFLDDACVCVGPEGEMCFTAKIGVPAGAGYFNTIINPNGELFHIECSVPGHDAY